MTNANAPMTRMKETLASGNEGATSGVGAEFVTWPKEEQAMSSEATKRTALTEIFFILHFQL